MHLIEHEAEQKVIATMRALRDGGASYRGICRELAADKIRNPAAVIGGTCKRILLEREDFSGKVRENLNAISEGAEKLECIVEQFMDLLKRRQTMFKYIDVNLIVKDEIPVVEKEAHDKGVKMSVNLFEEPLKINAHQSLLRMATFHLIRNAIEAPPEGGEVTVETFKEDDKIILAVSDTGFGIPSDFIDKIFEPFFSTKEHKFGMGLPLVKQVVAEHLGDIKVESRLGEGTTFKMIFPPRRTEKQLL